MRRRTWRSACSQACAQSCATTPVVEERLNSSAHLIEALCGVPRPANGLPQPGRHDGCAVLDNGLSRFSIARSSNMSSTEQMAGSFGGSLQVPCSIWELIMIQQQCFGGSVVSAPSESCLSLEHHTTRSYPYHGTRESIHDGYVRRYSTHAESTVEEFGMEPNAQLVVSHCRLENTNYPWTPKLACRAYEQKKHSNIRGTKRLVDEFGMRAGLFKGFLANCAHHVPFSS